MSQRTLVAAALAFALLLPACSDDTSGPTTGAAPSSTTTTEVPATTTTGASMFPREVLGVEIPAEPMRVVSASATHTEIAYALGAGERIVATDFFSDYPPEANGTQKIDAYNINVEAVAAFEPDLVLLSFDPGDVVASLDSLGIPTLLFPAPATLEDAYEQMEAVGKALGLDEAATDLVVGIRDDIDEIVAGIPGEDTPPTYYHELDGTYFTITSNTFIGTIYALVGMENIADPEDEAGFGYPQLSAEFIVESDPDFIFLADTVCCGESAETVGERPGWDTLSAVQARRVVELDDNVASRWGPRIVEFLETVVSNVYVGAE